MISVVIPYRDELGRLQACLGSLYRQESDLHIYIIDDCSSSSLKPHDIPTKPGVDIIVVTLPEHKGVQRCRNIGYEKADEELILFCDQDVVWYDGAIDSMKELLITTAKKDPLVGYVYGNYDRTGKVVGLWKAIPFNEHVLCESNYISTMSLIRRKVLDYPPFIEDEERLQDWSLWLRLLKKGVKGKWLDETVFSAHFGDHSISIRGEADFWVQYHKIRKRYASS